MKMARPCNGTMLQDGACTGTSILMMWREDDDAWETEIFSQNPLASSELLRLEATNEWLYGN